MPPRRAAAVIAAVVLALGVLLVLVPLSTGGARSVDCGSAFDPSYIQAIIRDAMDQPLLGSYVAQCEDEVSGRRLVAYPLAGAGALVLLFVWLTGQHPTRWDAERNPADESAA